ncbi:MAG: molybdopterin molybdotransferase MoeA [Phycisphaerae bacterium]|nr:molybdopterin molybdotransferase MoeA [Phycisphaerae bacterium]MBT6270342.1 molybdopterin molybdotransferase MoeA [Phycisphaerae bacterium]
MMNKLPSYAQALKTTRSLVQQTCVTERIPLTSSIGRVVANEIVADRDLPPFNRSQMDGYAVRASEVQNGTSMQVVGQVSAGTVFNDCAEEKTCVAIATGAPVPSCFDAVVQHECTDNGEDRVVFNCGAIKPGKSIHPCGVDAKAGDVLIGKHTELFPQHIGIAASVGVSEIEVLSKPKVIVLTSGDEVVDTNTKPLAHQIRNSNNPMIETAFTSMGCEVIETHHLKDDFDATCSEVISALDGRCDLLVTVGGISAGKRDYFSTSFDHVGVDISVKGVAIQPGKPVIVGMKNTTVVLGLPGNPVSALACSCIFGWPIVRGLQGVSATLPWQEMSLLKEITPNPDRLAFRPCSMRDGKITVPTWHGSGDFAHTAETNGLSQLPQSESKLQEGAEVLFLRYPWC